jgi:hypothetical protein
VAPSPNIGVVTSSTANLLAELGAPTGAKTRGNESLLNLVGKNPSPKRGSKPPPRGPLGAGKKVVGGDGKSDKQRRMLNVKRPNFGKKGAPKAGSRYDPVIGNRTPGTTPPESPGGGQEVVGAGETKAFRESYNEAVRERNKSKKPKPKGGGIPGLGGRRSEEAEDVSVNPYPSRPSSVDSKTPSEDSEYQNYVRLATSSYSFSMRSPPTPPSNPLPPSQKLFKAQQDLKKSREERERMEKLYEQVMAVPGPQEQAGNPYEAQQHQPQHQPQHQYQAQDDVPRYNPPPPAPVDDPEYAAFLRWREGQAAAAPMAPMAPRQTTIPGLAPREPVPGLAPREPIPGLAQVPHPPAYQAPPHASFQHPGQSAGQYGAPYQQPPAPAANPYPPAYPQQQQQQQPPPPAYNPYPPIPDPYGQPSYDHPPPVLDQTTSDPTYQQSKYAAAHGSPQKHTNAYVRAKRARTTSEATKNTIVGGFRPELQRKCERSEREQRAKRPSIPSVGRGSSCAWLLTGTPD